MGQKQHRKDPRVRATESIWAMAVGLFAICIPMVAITESGLLLPLLVLLGASSGTGFVWWSPHKREPRESRIAALEARIIDLETICTSLPSAEEMRLLAASKLSESKLPASKISVSEKSASKE